ncbi:hypothetical protein S40288_09798, partial [Stachybotrys chartarum IBT 40288]
TLINAEIVELLSLQEQLWNDAYEKVKSSEPKSVEAYEQILSSMLDEKKMKPTSCEPTENVIGGDRKIRSRQMQQLVRNGLDRTQRQGSIKQGIDEGLQVWQAVRGTVDKAVQMAPQAAVAWAGVCLGLEILSNPITEARNNRNGIAYVLSRMEWYWNLASLLLNENTSAHSTTALRGQLRQNIEHLYEKLLLYQMRSVRLYYRKWAVSIARDLIKMDDWDGQLSDIQDAESAVQRDMEQYNTEESKTRLRELSDAADTMQKSLQGIYSVIQNQAEQQEKWREDDKYNQIMKDLRETDPRDDKTRIQDHKGGLLRDSYHWILEHDDFRKWRSDARSQLLWIKGDPGKGKTMLLCGIIDELEKESGICLSYFFCEADEPRLSNATAVLRGLIYLLVARKPSLISHVQEKYEHAGKKVFEDGNAWEAFSKILESIIDDPSLEGAILLIDALDECKTNRQRLLSFIKKPSQVKWIVSSRNWQDIEESLDSTKDKIWLQLELNQCSISKAVQTYIDYRVDELAQLKRYDEPTKVTVRDHLTSNAHGTFLWVVLVCHELADPTITRNRHTLSQLKKFPSGLEPLYMQMMKQISESRDAEVCKELLAIASVVYRPITLEELKVLAESVEQDDYDDLPQIIKACGSFLTLRKGVMYFVHQSAKEFLLEKASEEILPARTRHQHYAVFSKSQRALSKILKQDLCKLGAPGFSIDQVSPRDLGTLTPLHYACVFWVDHLHDSDPTTIGHALRNDAVVHQFIQHKYLYWLEFLSILRSMPEGIKAVRKLEALARELGGQRLNELLTDARRFVLSHKTPIEVAPLQVYTSALLFSPERSLIRELFKDEEPDWLVTKPRMETDWNACLQTLEGHASWVTSVVFSADGQYVASGSEDQTAKIWELATGDCLHTLDNHGRSVTSVVFSADGKYLASGSGDNTVKIWDPATGDCLRTLLAHRKLVNLAVFSANGQYLVLGSWNNTVQIRDPATGDCLRTLMGHRKLVNLIEFSANSQYLALGSVDQTVKIWDLATGDYLHTLEGHCEPVTSVVFSANSQYLASGSEDQRIKI